MAGRVDMLRIGLVMLQGARHVHMSTLQKAADECGIDLSESEECQSFGFTIPQYGSTTIETIELTKEKERKEREKEFKKNFDIVKLESPSWTIDVPIRKNK